MIIRRPACDDDAGGAGAGGGWDGAIVLMASPTSRRPMRFVPCAANRLHTIGVLVTMSTRLTAPLVVCAAAATFAAAALIVNPEPARTTVAVAQGAPGGSTLSIQDFAFTPVTVAPGASVTVTNLDGEPHTVTADDGSFDRSVDSGASATFAAPTRPGTYPYVCTIHPSMHGLLVVA
jgi:plastocyanin